jgi:hypothetical protein
MWEDASTISPVAAAVRKVDVDRLLRLCMHAEHGTHSDICAPAMRRRDDGECVIV